MAYKKKMAPCPLFVHYFDGLAGVVKAATRLSLTESFS